MEELPTYHEKISSRKIDPNSKFVMIGNNIDGIVTFNFREFPNYQSLKENLEPILQNVKGMGEWDIKIYQVPNHYKIRKLYGYYRVPKPGRLIFEHSYMDNPINNVQENNNMLVFIGIYDYYQDNYDDNADEQIPDEITRYYEIHKLKLSIIEK